MSEETPAALALRTLQRLDTESQGRLLTLDDAERDQAYERLFAAARAAWPAGEPEPDYPVSFVEMAVEGQGELAWAAALYALLHDRQTGEDPLARCERAVFRFKLGHVLFLLDKHGKDNIRRCLGFAEETLRQAEALWRKEGISRNAFYSLIFELQSWMGHRYEALGLYELAEHAYSEASLVSRNTNDRVAYTTYTALMMEKLGTKQTAYELLLLVRDLLKEVEDEDVLALWETASASLRFELGGDLRNRGESFKLVFFESLSDAAHRAIHQNARLTLAGDGRVMEFIADLRQELDETPLGDVLLRHKLMSDLAFLLSSADRGYETADLLEQAEALEDSFQDELPKLERRIMIARRQKDILHDFVGARELFLDLLPDAERLLDGAAKLELYGYVLESLGAAREALDRDLLLDLTEKGCALFESILNGQPGSAARRRVREIHQRFFESAVLSLCIAAQPSEEEADADQELLARAWSVAMVARNPELRAAVQEPAADELRHLRELEDDFHRALRDRQDWIEPLEKVYEHELAVLRAARSPVSRIPLPSPPAQGVSLAFFLLRDLIAGGALLVLAHRSGRFIAHLIGDADKSILAPLTAWSARLSGQASGVSRDIRRVSSSSEIPAEESGALRIGRLLPPLFLTLFLPDIPWFLFPDGVLNETPLEMLPDREQTRFGQRRAVHLCLRPSVAAACGTQVGFSRGWLGLGGVPAALGLPYLSGSLDEVTGLARFLRGQGHSATVLTGPDATASGLRAHLEALPAVLHFAVHGSADTSYPDACALILADDHGSPENELLPFRRIRELDLSFVDLVVLSACKSLVGRSGRSAGIEGLAWAFLQAGASQVIASRYPVSDRHTVRFMAVLYEHLLSYPAAEALGHARDDCLKEMPAGQVGAWSVWS